MLILDAVDLLNSTYQGGKWLKTVCLVESLAPLVESCWVDHEDSITYGGRVYQPLKLFWPSIKTSVGMPTDGDSIAISNLGGQAVRYLKTLDPSGLPVTLQLLHLDRLSTMTKPFERYYKVRSVKADQTVCVFTLGRELGKNRLPRRVILAEEMQ